MAAVKRPEVPGAVALQIDQVEITGPADATATVRCLRGPVRRGARFDRILDTEETIELVLTSIHVYGRPANELDPVHTALVTLSGTGVQRLRAGSLADGWQVIAGNDHEAESPER